MAHAHCPKRGKAVSIYRIILPARMTVEKGGNPADPENQLRIKSFLDGSQIYVLMHE